MVELTNSLLLGEILQEAGLISDSQIHVALIDRQYNHDLRIGEIMALRGWIEQKTADFFAEEWQFLIQQPEKFCLGYYLEKSGLLTKDQTCSILAEQEKIWVKFGSVAIIKGMLKSETVDFFLKSLYPQAMRESSLIGRRQELRSTNLNQNKYKLANRKSEEKVDYEDIPWID